MIVVASAVLPPSRLPLRRRAGRALATELPPVTLSEYDGVRYLHPGQRVGEGAMRIRKPDAVELDYVQRMLASLLWLPTARLEHPALLHAGSSGWPRPPSRDSCTGNCACAPRRWN